MKGATLVCVIRISALLNRMNGLCVVIDFAWDLPSGKIQYNRFPIASLSLLASLKIELQITVYGLHCLETEEFNH